ncbi:MAG: hypothetical protein RIC55_23805 [Pirellulaceae bacterium]
MNHKLIVAQTQTETEALEHVTRALETAIAWVVEGDDLARKLSSVRFATELFQRQTERVFALEEFDGYMDTIRRSHPEFTDQVEEFKCEHEAFRAEVRKLALRLDRASPADVPNLDAVCAELGGVIQRILEHNRRESKLLVESLQRDTGGQG